MRYKDRDLLAGLSMRPIRKGFPQGRMGLVSTMGDSGAFAFVLCLSSKEKKIVTQCKQVPSDRAA